MEFPNQYALGLNHHHHHQKSPQNSFFFKKRLFLITEVYDYLRQCFLKCDPRNPAPTQDFLKGPWNKNYLPAHAEKLTQC